MAILSISIPTYNRVEQLKELVESILFIDTPDIEVVVTNNGCTDGTMAMLRGIDDLRLKVFTNDKPVPGYYNMILGLFNSNGKYVLHCNDRDILCTERLLEFVEFLKNNNYSYKYKKLVFVSLFITISGVIIGILGVVYSKYKYEFRVSSPIFVTTFIGIILYLNTYKQADYKFTTKYWKYALVLSIPLLPHYLSIKILNQVDRVMITQMVGLSETGLYNLACTVSNLMIIATDAINRSMCPYVYKSIKNKNILPVRKMTSSILLVVMVVSFLEMLIAPELIKIFATDDYLDAIYVIPPVAMSIYFIFLYVVFANVEFYFEKTIFATIVSGIAAVMNIGMNYIFLKKYGYYAAGYTTLICYMLFALLHYWNYKRILKREPYLNGIFDIRHVLLISFSGLALMGICLLLYRYSVIRFSLVIIIITISFYFRNQLKSIIKTSNN